MFSQFVSRFRFSTSLELFLVSYVIGCMLWPYHGAMLHVATCGVVFGVGGDGEAVLMSRWCMAVPMFGQLQWRGLSEGSGGTSPSSRMTASLVSMC